MKKISSEINSEEIHEFIISYSLSPTIAPKIAFINATTIASKAAAKNPVVLKDVIKLSTNNIINTEIIKDIKPSVRKFTGKVNTLKIKPMVALAKPTKMATIMALP